MYLPEIFKNLRLIIASHERNHQTAHRYEIVPLFLTYPQFTKFATDLTFFAVLFQHPNFGRPSNWPSFNYTKRHQSIDYFAGILLPFNKNGLSNGTSLNHRN